MTDIKPKFKFKKPKGTKKQLRRDAEDESHDLQNDPSAKNNNESSVDGEEESALDKIRDLERRRKLLSSKNRGVDAANLGKQTLRHKSTDSDDEGEEVAAVKNKDLEERLKGTFSEGKLAGSNDMGGDDEGGILAKKHKRAMEEYIKSNLQDQPSASGNGSASASDEEGGFKSSADMEKEMYSELLGTGNKGGLSPKKEEGDVGAGGAMMGGTGIAEVALPIDERIKAMKDTERAAMEYEKARKARLGIIDDELTASIEYATNEPRESVAIDEDALAALVPMNFASGPGKRKRKETGFSEPAANRATQQTVNKYDPTKDFQYPVHSSAIPPGSFIEKDNDTSELGASYSHNFAQHNREWIEQKKDERQAELDALAAQNVEDGPEESKARLGFEAARKLARGEIIVDASAKGTDTKNGWDRKGGTNDDRVWKEFMSNERNRR
jgi:hypothetical protein